MNAILPRKIPKAPKRSTRWRSQAHLKHVRSYACANCGSMANVEAAHIRLGSGAGMGQKPDDFRAVGLCGGPDGCHARQHRVGEETFWKDRDTEALIAAYIHESPRRFEIEQVMRERGE